MQKTQRMLRMQKCKECREGRECKESTISKNARKGLEIFQREQIMQRTKSLRNGMNAVNA